MAITKEDTTLIKGLAISLMLWHHLFMWPDEFSVLSQNIAVFAKTCVAFFLFVSGYGLTKQFSKNENHSIRTTFSFVMTRFAKFYLAYWFCMILVMTVGQICGYPFQDAYPSGRNTVKCILLDAMGILGYDSYLPTWWFNKQIIQLYLIFPFLYQLVRNKYVAIAALMVFIAIEQTSCINVFCFVEGGVVTYFLGMILAKWDFKIPDRWIGLVISMLALLALTIIRFRVSEIKYTVVDGFIVIAIVNILMFVKKYYSFPVLHYVGQYATIMYLTHTLIQILMGPWMFSINCSVVIYGVFISVALLIALLVKQMQKWCRYECFKAWVVRQIQKAFI